MPADTPDPAVARALRAVTNGGDLARLSDEELLAASLYANDVETTLGTAKGVLWAVLLDRGTWTVRRIADAVGVSKSTVHDCVQRYRRAAQ